MGLPLIIINCIFKKAKTVDKKNLKQADIFNI